MSADEQEFSALSDRLGSAFEDQADRFEPSHDAYARVAQAVATAQEPARSLGWFRPLAAAAAVAATVAVGGIALSAQGSQTLGTGPGDEQTAPSITGEPVTTLAPSAGEAEAAAATGADGETEATPTDTDAAGNGSAAGPVTGPVRSTRLEAAQAFLDLLRLPFGAPETVDDRVVVRSFAEGGVPSEDGRIVAELSLAEVDGGFAVTAAETESVSIASLDPPTPDGAIRVAGSGIGFEATLEIRVMSALDNRILAATTASAGSTGVTEPYSAEVPVVGAERGWVVVSGLGGADGVTEPFAAQPITFQTASDDPTDYAVIGVAPDDADGGLVVRSGPGTSNPRVGVIPGGSSGLRRNNIFPVAVGDDVWWSIAGPGGVDGWVNSRFVASNEPVSDQALEFLASTFLTSAGSDSESALNTLPFTRRAPVLIGTIAAPFNESAERLFQPSTWTEERSIAMPEEYGEPRVAPLSRHMWTDNWGDAELQPGGGYSYGPDRRTAEIYFAGLSSIVIAPENPNSPWDRTFLFVEDTPGGPEVLGMVVEVMRP